MHLQVLQCPVNPHCHRIRGCPGWFLGWCSCCSAAQCGMLCNNQPASGGPCLHVALQFPPKNAISQTRDDMEWTQLWAGAQGLHPAKAALVFWHCLGSVVALQVKRMFWQPPAAVGPSGPPCTLQHGNRDGGTPEDVPACRTLSSEEH